MPTLCFHAPKCEPQRGVGLFIELYSEPGGRLTDPLSDFGRVLTDSCGEHQAVKSAQDGGECADLFCGTIYKVIDGKDAFGSGL